MGKRPIKRTLRRDRGRANRRNLSTYSYIPTDYDKSLPSNINEEKNEAYNLYSKTITKDFCVEFAKDLDEAVDNARGNGRFEGKDDKKKRKAHERRYLKNRGIGCIGLHCEATPNYIANTDTIPQVRGADIYLEHPQTSGCPSNNEKNYDMIQQYPEIGGGYVNIKEYIAEVQKHDPYCAIDTVVPSTGNISGSGLHRVTIAPSIDDDGNVVIDSETKLPKMTVYSFNHARKTPLENYAITHGFCVNLNDYARHNLKEEYERNPEKTQEYIDAYNKEYYTKNEEKMNVDLSSVKRVPVVTPLYDIKKVRDSY